MYTWLTYPRLVFLGPMKQTTEINFLLSGGTLKLREDILQQAQAEYTQLLNEDGFWREIIIYYLQLSKNAICMPSVFGEEWNLSWMVEIRTITRKCLLLTRLVFSVVFKTTCALFFSSLSVVSQSNMQVIVFHKFSSSCAKSSEAILSKILRESRWLPQISDVVN